MQHYAQRIAYIPFMNAGKNPAHLSTTVAWREKSIKHSAFHKYIFFFLELVGMNPDWQKVKKRLTGLKEIKEV